MVMRRGLGGVCAALVVASGLFGATSVQADAGVQRLLGTWECHGPGQTHPLKPPIMWFGASGDGIGLDGFSGTLYGQAEVTGNPGESLRIAVRNGESITVSDLTENGPKASMTLHRDAGTNYRCNRLPRLD
jgi:hypothetical protein